MTSGRIEVLSLAMLTLRGVLRGHVNVWVRDISSLPYVMKHLDAQTQTPSIAEVMNVHIPVRVCGASRRAFAA